MSHTTTIESMTPDDLLRLHNVWVQLLARPGRRVFFAKRYWTESAAERCSVLKRTGGWDTHRSTPGAEHLFDSWEQAAKVAVQTERERER